MQTPQDRQRIINRFGEPSSRTKFGDKNISAFTHIFSRKVSDYESSGRDERLFDHSEESNFDEVRLREALFNSMKIKRSFNNQQYSPGSSTTALSMEHLQPTNFNMAVHSTPMVGPTPSSSSSSNSTNTTISAKGNSFISNNGNTINKILIK